MNPLIQDWLVLLDEMHLMDPLIQHRLVLLGERHLMDPPHSTLTGPLR